jgi:MoaA/NifB/PqqE/SkfB family radical SAM enzyme
MALAFLEKGIFSSPYEKLGNIYRLNHFNQFKVSMPRLMRRHWLKDTDLKERDPVAYFIVGEGTLVQNIQEALDEKYVVEMVTGPHLRNQATREELANLLKEAGPEKLKIFSNEIRPRALINKNILFEDFHPEKQDYDEATVIEKADKYNIQLARNRFDQLKKSPNTTVIDTPEKVLQMPTQE